MSKELEIIDPNLPSNDSENIVQGNDNDRTIQLFNETAGSAQALLSLYAQCKEVEAKTEQLKIWSNVKIAEITAKYKSCQDFLEKTFGERDKALSKHYELLDNAIASGDRELIIHSLHGISNIVTSSPLDDFEEFVKLYEDTSRPLLDF
ncbi:MAG: hypothetical protein IJG54_04415 [Bacteroidales bacterium]|jgi:hypothetical protein|nr:hypothetical protein [Bacteroidales bacterium]